MGNVLARGGMHFVIFGLTVSSSWGNGHATLWRGLIKALARRRHTLTFYEKDVPYYASTRDGWQPPDGVTLRLYHSLEDIRHEAASTLEHCDVAMSTSYCPDSQLAAELILSSSAPVRAFYDLDSPVTLEALAAGESVPYIPSFGLGPFDLVLSYTGGKALTELQTRLAARNAVPLYGSVDPETHSPASTSSEFAGVLSYLGTYAADRQQALEELFVRPASLRQEDRFVLAGAQYPADFPWTSNMYFLRHIEPALHPTFFCSSKATLNITRRAMAQYGYCPSGRLFEAAACGACIVSDWWEGLEIFFEPGTEILRVDTAEDVVEVLKRPREELRAIGEASKRRALREHTAEQRAITLEQYCGHVASGIQALAHTA